MGIVLDKELATRTLDLAAQMASSTLPLPEDWVEWTKKGRRKPKQNLYGHAWHPPMESLKIGGLATCDSRRGQDGTADRRRRPRCAGPAPGLSRFDFIEGHGLVAALAHRATGFFSAT